MSDHEGCNEDEWEEGSLPGPPALPSEAYDRFDKVVYRTSVPGTATIHSAVTSQFHALPRRIRNANGDFLPQNGHPPRGVSQNYRPQIQGLNNRVGGIRARQSLVQSTAVNNDAFASFKRQENPTGEYTFQVTWGLLLRSMRGEDIPASEAARERLNQISQKTETFIATPDFHANKALIWGNENQVALCRQQLDLFEKDVRDIGNRQAHQRNWVKTGALDGRKEHRDDRKNKFEESVEQYRKYGKSPDFGYEQLVVLSRELDLEQFIAEYDGSVIDLMRRKYMCSIEYDKTAFVIHICAENDKSLQGVYQRTVNLVKEMVARLNQNIKANFFHLPDASLYRNRVGMDQDPSSLLFLPTLHGERLPAQETEDWEALCRKIHRRNRSNIAMSIDKCLKSLQVSERHVRMRVTFGELGFMRHKKPADGKDSHTFDDFCEMVKNERTELQLQGLRSNRGGDISALADELAKYKEFSEQKTTYAVYFDFQPSGHENTAAAVATLRLDSEFRVGADTDELEVSQKRWLEIRPGTENDLVAIHMLDFEKINWQFTINATAFCDNRQTRLHMQQFENNLGFRPPPDGIRSYPKRRAIYPPGNRDLKQVSELTVVSFRFKKDASGTGTGIGIGTSTATGTATATATPAATATKGNGTVTDNGTGITTALPTTTTPAQEGRFELRRRDVYSETPCQTSSYPVESTWTATYYYPEWDNLLGDFAYLKPGDQVSWHRALATFFPDDDHNVQVRLGGAVGAAGGKNSPHPNHGSNANGNNNITATATATAAAAGGINDQNQKKPTGFKKFMQEVEEIQELLTRAIGNLSI